MNLYIDKIHICIIKKTYKTLAKYSVLKSSSESHCVAYPMQFDASLIIMFGVMVSAQERLVGLNRKYFKIRD